MNLQSKLMLLVGGAAVVAMLLVFVLVGVRMNSMTGVFNDATTQMIEENMQREAYSAVTAEGALLDSTLNSMFLRLNMLNLIFSHTAEHGEKENSAFRKALENSLYILPSTDGESASVLPPETDLCVVFGWNGSQKVRTVFYPEKDTPDTFVIPKELLNFQKNQLKNIGAVVVPEKPEDYIWTAFNWIEGEKHFVAAFKVNTERLLKKINTGFGDSYSIFVHGNSPLGSCETISTNIRPTEFMRKSMIRLAARLVPLQNSRISELEKIENPGESDSKWEAASITLKTHSIPAKGLRLVTAFPYYAGKESASEYGIQKSGRFLIPVFFSILIGLFVFFVPLILVVKRTSNTVRELLDFSNTAAKGEASSDNLRITDSVELMELSGSLTHLRDKINGIQLRLKKSHERELLARRDAEASNRLKSSLLNDMVSEMKEPINLVVGFSALLIRKLKHQSDAVVPLQKIHEESIAIDRMVHSIGELSRLDSAEVEPSYSEFDFSSVVTEVSDACFALSSERHVSLEVHCSEMPEKIISDKLILAHIMKLAATTLLLFAPPKTKVKWVCAETEKYISFCFSDEKNESVPSIADIFGEHLALIGRNSKSSPGYGAAILNLTVLKAQATLLGALVEIRSTDTANTVIEIAVMKNEMADLDPNDSVSPAAYLNSREKSARTSTFDPDHIHRNLRKIYMKDNRPLQLLLAERSESGTTMISMMLENENCAISCVKSPEECMESLKNKNFDLLLLDLNLQRALSSALISAIRKEISHSIVIIAMASNLTEAESEAIKESGVDACLQKPIGEEELKTAIKGFIA